MTEKEKKQIIRDRKYLLNKNRRALVKGATGSLSFEEWENLKIKYGNRCASCREQKDLTVDHIVPLSKGGSNLIENIQPLCRSCNSKKSTKVIKYA